MARNLAKTRGRERELEFAREFEAREPSTLGIVYEKSPRFAGGAYGAFLKKVDRFGDQSLSSVEASAPEEAILPRASIEIDARVENPSSPLCRPRASSPRPPA